MATWTTISNAAVAVGGIPSSTTVTALRDNPSAIAESASGAPVVASAWHPYNKVYVGDGQTGLIYDFAVNGTQASVVTPDFEDGYEYRIIAIDLGENGIGNSRLWIDVYGETDAAYRTVRFSSENDTVGQRFGCDVQILTPRISRRAALVEGFLYRNDDFNTDATANNTYKTPAQKLLRARVLFSNGSINNGQIYFLRRREYVTSP